MSAIFDEEYDIISIKKMEIYNWHEIIYRTETKYWRNTCLTGDSDENKVIFPDGTPKYNAKSLIKFGICARNEFIMAFETCYLLILIQPIDCQTTWT